MAHIMFDQFPKNKIIFIDSNSEGKEVVSAISVEAFEAAINRSKTTSESMIPFVIRPSIASLVDFFSLMQSRKSCIMCSKYDLEYVTKMMEATKLAGLKEEALIGFFTSATTGKPTIVFHDISEFIARFKPGVRPLHSICFYKPDHIAFVDVLLSTIASGGSMVLQEHFNALKAFDDIQRFNISHLFASPSFLNLMFSDAADWTKLKSLKQICYGSELLPKTLLAKIKKNLPEVSLKNIYATTQALRPQINHDALDATFYKFGEEGLHYRIENDELYLRRPASLRYLIKNDQVLEAPDWIATGDMVIFNTHGFYKVVGRRSDLINVGGEKILPKHIEDILLELAEVKDVKVYGEPNAILGEIVCADIVSSAHSIPSVLKEKIRSFAVQKLKPEEMPIKINFVTEIRLSERLKR